MAADESGSAADAGPIFPLAPPAPGQGAGWAKLAAAVEALEGARRESAASLITDLAQVLRP
jgi:hypothetical protein